MQNEYVAVFLCEGKYEIRMYKNMHIIAMRYGELWRDMSGDKMMAALLDQLLTPKDEYKDPTGFSSAMVKDEADKWTPRATGKEMLLNYAEFLETLGE